MKFLKIITLLHLLHRPKDTTVYLIHSFIHIDLKVFSYLSHQGSLHNEFIAVPCDHHLCSPPSDISTIRILMSYVLRIS